MQFLNMAVLELSFYDWSDVNDMILTSYDPSEIVRILYSDDFTGTFLYFHVENPKFFRYYALYRLLFLFSPVTVNWIRVKTF